MNPYPPWWNNGNSASAAHMDLGNGKMMENPSWRSFLGNPFRFHSYKNWLVVEPYPSETYESQWEGWYPIYEMENNPNVWNHQPEKYWFSNWRVHVLILSDVGCMNTSLEWIEIQQPLISWSPYMNFAYWTFWGKLHTGDAVCSFVHRPIDPRCRASEVQHPPKLRLLSKQMIFIWSKDTQKNKGCAKRNFLQGQSGAPRLQEEPIIWCCACGKAHHCNILRV